MKLNYIIRKNKSNLVIGLDSDIEKLPLLFLKYKNPVSEFNKLIIESTKDLVAGYKLNIAFYECLEEKGLEAIRDSLFSIPNESIKICDAKRCDIENTSELYARTYFDKYNFDSITLSPYMGEDSISPFISRKDKGVYILSLTSNPGGKDFQTLRVNGKYLYEIVIEQSLKWNKNKNIGFVFGANHIKELKNFTSLHPEIPLLIPGIGAQVNDLKELIESLNSDNFVINSSRGIIYSAKKDCTEKEFVDFVRTAAIDLNSGINKG
ncbi:MAG: orotidine-5'-phosphate decarboxylase [Bacteroidota bacterium]|nr:orotidine-5'-phosphate decarboxylase [Bacteroidota bacterium]